jgi:hypothetical protein
LGCVPVPCYVFKATGFPYFITVNAPAYVPHRGHRRRQSKGRLPYNPAHNYIFKGSGPHRGSLEKALDLQT